MNTRQTIAQALAEATTRLVAASATPRLDAELLLAHVLGFSRARLLAEGRTPLEAADADAFVQALARRETLEPVAYITGEKAFFGLDFMVTRDVLVPRPETELLVEQALLLASRRPGLHTIADIGTGCGCIAVALAANLPRARVLAIDLSPAALSVARHNIHRHGLADRISTRQGDLLTPLDAPVDLLVSNPPYTILRDIDENVRRHEPPLALDGGPDGLAPYRRLLADAPRVLMPGGAIVLEIGETQGQAVARLGADAFPRAAIAILPDLAGLDRVVVIDTGI